MAREQISLQCLGVSSVAGEHLVKDVGNLRVVLLKSVHCSESAGRSALLQALVLELDNPRAHGVWPVHDVEECQLQIDVNNQLY